MFISVLWGWFESHFTTRNWGIFDATLACYAYLNYSQWLKQQIQLWTITLYPKAGRHGPFDWDLNTWFHHGMATWRLRHQQDWQNPQISQSKDCQSGMISIHHDSPDKLWRYYHHYHIMPSSHATTIDRSPLGPLDSHAVLCHGCHEKCQARSVAGGAMAEPSSSTEIKNRHWHQPFQCISKRGPDSLINIYIYIYIFNYTYTHTHTHIYIYNIHTYIHIYIYIYVCVCVCVNMYITYIYIQCPSVNFTGLNGPNPGTQAYCNDTFKSFSHSKALVSLADSLGRDLHWLSLRKLWHRGVRTIRDAIGWISNWIMTKKWWIVSGHSRWMVESWIMLNHILLSAIGLSQCFYESVAFTILQGS